MINKKVFLLLTYVIGSLFSFLFWNYLLFKEIILEKGLLKFYFEHSSFEGLLSYFIGPIIHIFILIKHEYYTVDALLFILFYVTLVILAILLAKPFLEEDAKLSKKKYGLMYLGIIIIILFWSFSGVLLYHHAVTSI